MGGGRARRLERFLTQPFFTTEQFTGHAGKLVGLEASLDGCERILRDEFKDYPESALYMIGAVGEASKPGKPGARPVAAGLPPNAGAPDDKPAAKAAPVPRPVSSQPRVEPGAAHES
jgi:F-type H+-transporting ATPase subunit beta